MALLREDFYAHVRQTFGNQVYNELRSGSDERKLQTFIGKRVLALLNLNIQKHSQNGHLLRVNVYAFCLAWWYATNYITCILWWYVLFLCSKCKTVHVLFLFFAFKISRVGHCYHQLLLVYSAFYKLCNIYIFHLQS